MAEAPTRQARREQDKVVEQAAVNDDPPLFFVRPHSA